MRGAQTFARSMVPGAMVSGTKVSGPAHGIVSGLATVLARPLSAAVLGLALSLSVALALALTLALALASPARAEIVLVEQAYELIPSRLQLPANPAPGDSLRLRPCADCPQVSLRVSTRTQWRIGQRGPLVTAAEFRNRFQQALAGSGDALVFVYYDPSTRTVNRVVLSATGPGSAATPGGTP